VTERELRRLLLDVPAPDEEGAGERTWQTVRAALEEREPVSWPVRHARPLIACAVAAALIAAAFTPPGEAVVNEVRDAIGRERAVGVEQAEAELFSLPGPGRALVESGRGLWVVRQDGSRRFVGRYRHAAWSPHGLFIAAVRGNQLAAFDDRGKLRWSVPRRGFVGSPSWTGTRTDTRIAYLAGSVPRRELRVIAGDGTDDRLIARRVAPVAPAWRPGPERELAFVRRSGRMLVADADSGALRWGAAANPKSARLEWSADGRRLLVADGNRLRVFGADGTLAHVYPAPRGFLVVDGTFGSDRRAAYIAVHPPRNESRIFVDGRQLFAAGPGRFTSLRWSPDGRRLAFAWREADQLVFLPVPRASKIKAVANVSRHFGRAPRITGWCCAPAE
jgi:dipeptidyl aminopeptidase/acylaminoacyl peptidase